MFIHRYINQIAKKSPIRNAMRGLISRSSCLGDSKNYKSSKFLYQIIDTPLFQYFDIFFRWNKNSFEKDRSTILAINPSPKKKNIFPKKKRKELTLRVEFSKEVERENPLLAASWDGSAERRAQGQDRCASLPAATGGGVWGAATLVARSPSFAEYNYRTSVHGFREAPTARNNSRARNLFQPDKWTRGRDQTGPSSSRGGIFRDYVQFS